MANHNKNKKFGGSERVERVRKTRRVGQDALERERRRKLERGTVRPLPETDYDLLIDYTDVD